jgi:hypothetical protein
MGIENPEIHLAYMALFMRISDSLRDLEPCVVGVDTAIKLSTINSEKWLKIINIENPDQSKWEFSPASKQAQRLIGCKVGAKVVFREGPIEELTYRVDTIQSIYLRAYQKIYDEFSTRFPDHLGIQRIEVANNDFSKFFIFITQHSFFAQKVYSAYERGAITVEQFANLIGRRYTEVFSSLQNTSEEKVFASYGSHEDQANQEKACIFEEEISLSLSAFLTFSYLDLLELLTNRFRHIYISQRFVDELERSLLNSYFDFKKGIRTIGIAGERPVIEEISPSTLQRNIQ